MLHKTYNNNCTFLKKEGIWEYVHNYYEGLSRDKTRVFLTSSAFDAHIQIREKVPIKT